MMRKWIVVLCLSCIVWSGSLFAEDLQSKADTLVDILAEHKSLATSEGFAYRSNWANMIDLAAIKRPDIEILPYLYNAVVAKKLSFSYYNNWLYDKNGLLILLNDQRSVEWLSWLIYNPALDRLAQSYADYLYQHKHFSHVSLSGESLEQRIKTVDYPYSLIGENLASWYTDIVEVLAGRYNSPTHKANLLEPWFVHMWLGRSGEYRVQLFGRPE